VNKKILFIKFVVDRVRKGKWKMEKLSIYSIPLPENLRWRDNMGYIGDIIGNEYKSWGEPNLLGIVSNRNAKPNRIANMEEHYNISFWCKR